MQIHHFRIFSEPYTKRQGFFNMMNCKAFCLNHMQIYNFRIFSELYTKR